MFQQVRDVKQNQESMVFALNILLRKTTQIKNQKNER